MKLSKDTNITLYETGWDVKHGLYMAIDYSDKHIVYQGTVENIDVIPFCYYDAVTTGYVYVTEENNVYLLDDDDDDDIIVPLEEYIHEQQLANKPIELEHLMSMYML